MKRQHADVIADSIEGQPAPNQVRPSDVLVVGATITPDLIDAVRTVEGALVAAVIAADVPGALHRLTAIRRAVSMLHPRTVADDGVTPICATCVNLGEHDNWPCPTLMMFELPLCEHGVPGGGHDYGPYGGPPEWCEYLPPEDDRR